VVDFFVLADVLVNLLIILQNAQIDVCVQTALQK